MKEVAVSKGVWRGVEGKDGNLAANSLFPSRAR